MKLSRNDIRDLNAAYSIVSDAIDVAHDTPTPDPIRLAEQIGKALCKVIIVLKTIELEEGR